MSFSSEGDKPTPRTQGHLVFLYPSDKYTSGNPPLPLEVLSAQLLCSSANARWHQLHWQHRKELDELESQGLIVNDKESYSQLPLL